jgi:hypothetical protein
MTHRYGKIVEPPLGSISREAERERRMLSRFCHVLWKLSVLNLEGSQNLTGAVWEGYISKLTLDLE